MKRTTRNLVILFFTLVVVMMGFGMIIPIIPFYIDAFGASGRELGLLMAIFATMQFFFAPVWGKLSDRRGRKAILMVGVVGNAVTQLFFGLATDLWMLFAARALAGILSSATIPTAMAYIGDSTTEEDRGGGMGILGAAMGVGMVLGPGLGGTLASQSLSLPFFVAAGLSALALPFIFFVLPESLPKEARTHQPEGVGTWQEFRSLWGSLFRDMWQGLTGPIGLLLILAFLLSFGLTNFEGIFGLYAMQRYSYGPERVGILLTAIGLISAVVQGVLTGPLTRRWGEAALIRASLLGSAVGFLLMLQARSFVAVLLTVSFFVLSNAMLRPAVSSLISKRASGGQGMAMGLNNSFMSLGRIVGPTWSGFVFDINLSYPYYSGALIMAAGLLASMLWLKPQRSQIATQKTAAEPEAAP